MNATAFYRKYLKSDRNRLEAVCKAAGTTFANFQQIAIASGSVSPRLAQRLEEASDGEMSKVEILFPADIPPESGRCA